MVIKRATVLIGNRLGGRMNCKPRRFVVEVQLFDCQESGRIGRRFAGLQCLVSLRKAPGIGRSRFRLESLQPAQGDIRLDGRGYFDDGFQFCLIHQVQIDFEIVVFITNIRPA